MKRKRKNSSSEVNATLIVLITAIINLIIALLNLLERILK